MATDSSFGTRIRRARERKRWSQQDLADRLGVAVRTVGDWENDRAKPRSAIGALEDHLNIDLTTGAEPGLPPEIEQYGHIPEVAAIWEIPDEKMPAATRLGLIRLWLSRHQEPPSSAGAQDRRTA